MNRSETFQKVGVGAVLLCAAGLAVVAVLKMEFWSGAGMGDSFKYDLSRHRQFQPESLAYKENGSFPCGFKVARGLAVDELDNIFVAGDMGISRFSPSGDLLERIGDCPSAPRCVAVVGGKVYVGLMDAVVVRGPGGAKEWKTLVELGQKTWVTSIAVSGDNVFVADKGNRIVRRYNLRGEFLGQIGKADKDRGIDGFLIPSPHFKVAVAPDGLLRVVNPGRQKIEAYTFQGDLEWRWGVASINNEGFSGCCNPASFAIFPDGRIVTAEKGELAMVKVFSQDGPGPVGAELQAIVAGPQQFPELKQAAVEFAPDVVVDSTGRIIVLDPACSRVRIFVAKPTATRKTEPAVGKEGRP